MKKIIFDLAKLVERVERYWYSKVVKGAKDWKKGWRTLRRTKYKNDIRKKHRK